MPSVERFNALDAPPADLREEADCLEETADALHRMVNRGHLKRPGSIAKALDLHEELRARMHELRDQARLAELKPISKEAV